MVFSLIILFDYFTFICPFVLVVLVPSPITCVFDDCRLVNYYGLAETVSVSVYC